MPKSRLVMARGSGVSQTIGAAQFYPVGNGVLPNTNTAQTETNIQVIHRTAGTFSNLYIRFITNTYTSTTTFTLRKNAANTTETITITANTAGVYEDTTHTDSIAAGDKMTCTDSLATSSKNHTVSVIAFTFDATGTTNTRCMANTVGTSLTSQNVARYEPVCGLFLNTNTTEANAKTRIQAAGTFKNLAIRTSAGTTAGTCKSRKNGADGNLSATLSTAAGWYEDTTNLDNVVSGDDFNSTYVFNSTGGETVQHIAMDFQDGSAGFGMFENADPTLATVNANVTTNFGVAGELNPTVTETDVKCLAKDVYILQDLTINVTANTVSAASNLRYRDTGANATQVVTITANTAGLYTDSTHTDTTAATDDMNYQLITGATGTSLTISFIDMFYSNGTVGLTRVVQSDTLKYNVIGRVVHSDTLKWNVLKQVKQPQTLKYNVLKQIKNSNTLKYNIIQRILHSNTLKYNLIGRVVHSNTLKYNILKQVKQQNTLKYNILKQIKQNQTLKYNLLKTIVRANTLKYNILNKVIHAYTLKYNVLKQVKNSNTLKFNVLKQIRSLIKWDDFEAGTYSFTEGGSSPNGKWNNVYLGGTGATSGVRFSASAGSNVMYQKPQASTTSGETHATFTLATPTWGDFDLTYNQRTVQQLRTGSVPNSWEAAWILFRYTDPYHHYYLVLKTTGVELGRKDYATPQENQMFLATPSTPTLTIGNWNTVRIRAIRNRFIIYIDGVQVIDFTDDGSVGFDSATSGLPPPPSATMYAGQIGLYNEDAEVEFDNVQTNPVIKYNVLKQVKQSRTLKYNVLKQVLQHVTLKWNILANLSRIVHANTLKYNLIGRVTHQNTLQWNILKQVKHNQTLKYNLLRQILHNQTLKYNIIGRIIHANTLKYNILRQIKQQNTLKYNIIQRVKHADTLKYNLLQQIKHANTLQWNLIAQLARIVHANTLKYNLIGRITHQNTLKYNILKQVKQNQTLKYNLLKQVLHNQTLKYNIIGRIVHSNILKYNVLQQIKQNQTLKYNLLQQIKHANTLKFNLLLQVKHAVTLQWNLFATLSRIVHANTLKWNLIGRVKHANTLQYNVLKQVKHPDTLKYNILRQITHNQTLKYNIFQRILHSDTLKYNILRQIKQQNILKYNILRQIKRPNTLKYNILRQIKQQLTLKYNVLSLFTRVFHSFTLKWNIFFGQRSDRGGWYWKEKVRKPSLIKYPVYIVSERERLERRLKLRQYPPLIVIPAFKYNINVVVAPFIVTDPISQRVYVKFAIADNIARSKGRIIYHSKVGVPIAIVPRPQKTKLNTAKCAAFVPDQRIITTYGAKLNKLAKVMRVWNLAKQLLLSDNSSD